ncbi:hypothetical protein CAXC1_30016 [Candidatus Xenohaliotis californiensis]|uniref:Uncharacterized protein n=1 Tax=Candidatus Xenohaliotis californiensis TaxID=84677 RepID=A0ABM9N908_9RICK|nr:hypothetical protein CAXC1_30016 [Candidatus Xenohaliotis californiensis]
MDSANMYSFNLLKGTPPAIIKQQDLVHRHWFPIALLEMYAKFFPQ